MKLNKEEYIAKYGEDKYKERLEYLREFNRKRQHYRHCNDMEWKQEEMLRTDYGNNHVTFEINV